MTNEAGVRQYSDYVIYVDESGDHSLGSVNPEFPVFVLAFVLFAKKDYLAFLPKVHDLKFRHFGHDSEILHEIEIRRAEGAFKFLVDPQRRGEFLAELACLVQEAPFELIASSIRKDKLKAKYASPANPYSLALLFNLERALGFLERREQANTTTHVIAERRGKKEDAELELEFRRICDRPQFRRYRQPFELVFVDKRANSAGLQLADLCARPVARQVLAPEQHNRAFEVLRPKLHRSSLGKVEGYGLKVFP